VTEEDVKRFEEELSHWMTTSRAARVTGMSEAWLRKMRSAGKLRYVTHEGRIFYYAEDIQKNLPPKGSAGRPKKEARRG